MERATSSDLEAAYRSYLEPLIVGDILKCREVVEGLISNSIDIRDLYLGVFQRAQYRVGELWECNQLSVANEHAATAITESLLSLAYPVIFVAPHCGRKAVVACAINEYHQLGGKMVADILELNGWDAHFSGANTPTKELLALIDSSKLDMLCLSLSILSGLPALSALLEQLRGEFPSLPILVGGQAFRWIDEKDIGGLSGAEIVRSIDKLEQLVEKW